VNDALPEVLALAGHGLAAVLAMMTLLWAASVRARDASLVDRFWGIGFVVLAWVYALAAGVSEPFPKLVVVLVSVWGLRLSAHITVRNRGHGEDRRYARMRAAHGRHFWWRSLFSVFLLQGVIAWLVAAPLAFVMANPVPVNGTGWVVAGVALWTLGLAFEAGGDWQLARFKRDPANRGKLLTTGLWSLTRHPNYFGDAMVWWGFGTLALAVESGWMSLPGPLLMTLLIRYVSGVAMLERDRIRNDPQYADYIRRTPAFVPRPPWTRR